MIIGLLQFIFWCFTNFLSVWQTVNPWDHIVQIQITNTSTFVCPSIMGLIDIAFPKVLPNFNWKNDWKSMNHNSSHYDAIMTGIMIQQWITTVVEESIIHQWRNHFFMNCIVLSFKNTRISGPYGPWNSSPCRGLPRFARKNVRSAHIPYSYHHHKKNVCPPLCV